jgi:PAS domain S-box-containing protein
MTLAEQALHDGAIAGFILLGGVSIRDWVRFRDRAHAAVAMAFGSLGILGFSWLANDATDYESRAFNVIAVIAFMASGYGLLAIRAALVPVRPSTRRSVAAAMALVAFLYVVVLRPPLGLHVRYSIAEAVSLWLMVGLWIACAGDAIVTLWRAARDKPAVQRARLRTLSFGTAALVGVLIGYASKAPDGNAAGDSFAITVAATLLLPIMWAAFSPPRMLRRFWRVEEEEALRHSLHELFLETPDRGALAERALAWALRLIGADGGMIVTADGEVLASAGGVTDIPTVPNVTASAVLLQGKVPTIVAPLQTADGKGLLVVVGGRYAPVFGSDELSRLEQWAMAVGVAIDRVRIVEELQGQTEKHEWILRAMSDLGEGVVIGNIDSIAYVNDAYCEMVGYTRTEVLSMPDLLDLVVPEGRQVAIDNARKRRAGLAAPDRYDLRLTRKDGTIIDVEVAVKPYEVEGAGHYIGVFRNITARKRAVEALRNSEARHRSLGEALARETSFVRLLQDVAVAANESGAVDEALQQTIDLICKHTGWPIGHAYSPAPDPTGDLMPTTIWHLASEERFARFKAVTEALPMRRGVGLPGRVAQLGAPVWIEDAMRDDDSPSLRFAADVGVRSGFAFPVLVGTEVAAVLEFFSPDPVPPDGQLLEVTRHIGAQLGRVVERVRAKRTVEEREKQLQEAQSIARIGSWEWDVSSNRVVWSKELYRIYGLDHGAFKASFEGYLERVHPQDRDHSRHVVEQALVDRRPFTFDHRVVRPDGSIRTVHARGEVLTHEDGRPARMVGTGQDVTEQRLAEAALRSAYDREREALEGLRKLDEMKSAILSAVSHELRTPLTVILGFAQTMQREGMALSAADRTAFMTRITTNAQKLDRLLSDLLDLDRIDRGILEPRRRPTDLGALIARIVEQSGLAEARRVMIDSDAVTISVDGPRVERIVENLLVNAARHTPDGSRVWVQLRAVPGGAEIAVEDDGSGVDADQRESVFEPFRQGPSAPAHSPGVGIGLSLVSRFATMHGGRAWVEERAGGGASFRVFLPGGPETEGQTLQPAHAAADPHVVPNVKAG